MLAFVPYALQRTPLKLGLIYPVQLSLKTFRNLEHVALIQRAELSLVAPLSPFVTLADRLGAPAVHRTPDTGATGHGVLIGTIDAGIDVLHPHLFKADAGVFHFEDIDRNGALTPEHDAVDLNGDGFIEEHEKLQVLKGSRAVGTTRQNTSLQNSEGQFDSKADWLYLDLNGNGQRDAGIAAGFEEADPAYGEPIFVSEDLNQNGIIDEGEFLYRLGSSKIVKQFAEGHAYVRGIDLIESTEALSEHASHGTAVASILVGGQSIAHDLIGVAPDAEIITYDPGANDNVKDQYARLRSPPFVAMLADAQQAGARGMIHEWNDVTSLHDDGSSALELAMDAAASENMVQVCPTGNLGHSGKHIERSISPNADSELNFEFIVGRGFPGANGGLIPFRFAVVRFVTTSQTMPSLTITPVNRDASRNLYECKDTRRDDDFSMVGITEVSPRGNRLTYMLLFGNQTALAPSRVPLPVGQYTITMNGLEADSIVRGRLDDGLSSWNRGIAWLEPTSTSGTMAYPSSANNCLSVGAVGGHRTFQEATTALYASDDSGPGDLRGYSGMGPRIDGHVAVDLVAPDDPLVANSIRSIVPNSRNGFNAVFKHFGGTSGASPFVLGAIALLAEKYPNEGAPQLRQRIIDGADAPRGQPHQWGNGELNIYRTLVGDDSPRVGSTPWIRDVRVQRVGDEVSFLVTETSFDEADQVEYSFDIDGDGHWEHDWSTQFRANSVLPTSAMVDGDASRFGRVRIRNQFGLSSGISVEFTPNELEVLPGTTPSPRDDIPSVLFADNITRSERQIRPARSENHVIKVKPKRRSSVSDDGLYVEYYDPNTEAVGGCSISVAQNMHGLETILTCCLILALRARRRQRS